LIHDGLCYPITTVTSRPPQLPLTAHSLANEVLLILTTLHLSCAPLHVISVSLHLITSDSPPSPPLQWQKANRITDNGHCLMSTSTTPDCPISRKLRNNIRQGSSKTEHEVLLTTMTMHPYPVILFSLVPASHRLSPSSPHFPPPHRQQAGWIPISFHCRRHRTGTVGASSSRFFLDGHNIS